MTRHGSQQLHEREKRQLRLLTRTGTMAALLVLLVVTPSGCGVDTLAIASALPGSVSGEPVARGSATSVRGTETNERLTADGGPSTDLSSFGRVLSVSETGGLIQSNDVPLSMVLLDIAVVRNPAELAVGRRAVFAWELDGQGQAVATDVKVVEGPTLSMPMPPQGPAPTAPCTEDPEHPDYTPVGPPSGPFYTGAVAVYDPAEAGWIKPDPEFRLGGRVRFTPDHVIPEQTDWVTPGRRVLFGFRLDSCGRMHVHDMFLMPEAPTAW